MITELMKIFGITIGGVATVLFLAQILMKFPILDFIVFCAFIILCIWVYFRK